ncbi:MAG TPA: ribosome recycling factor [Patescibacteria group bacterium]|nr:ribosome recycling factor [Patescibacteria group bacterium]
MDLNATREKMQQVLSVLRNDLGTVRTGRAAPSLVENIVVGVYGGSTRLRILELAQVSSLDSQTLLITPYDPSTTPEIAKGIMEANVGLTPSEDSGLIRISIPPLSQERRQELVQLVNQKLESGRIQVRQIRHTALDELKKAGLSEDEATRVEKEIQNLTDSTISEVDSLGKRKEEELMQI